MAADLARGEVRVPHKGMPPLDMSGEQISFFEFWPQKYFYAPVFLYWMWLTLRHGGRFTLPTISNPLFPMGGWIGESKATVFEYAGAYARKFIAPWAVVERTPALTRSLLCELRCATASASSSRSSRSLTAATSSPR